MNFNKNTFEELQTLLGKKVVISATDRIVNQYKVVPNSISYTILEVTADTLSIQPSFIDSDAIKLPLSVNGFLWGIKSVYNG